MKAECLTFNSKWTLWHHSVQEKNWELTSYNKLICIENTSEFWNTIEHINLETSMLFLMRENILPLWESPDNISGGSWSFMIENNNAGDILTPNKAVELFKDFAIGMVGENLIETNTPETNLLVNGISITPKTNSYIIKIWAKKFIEPRLLNKTFITPEIQEKMIFRYHKKINEVKQKHKKPKNLKTTKTNKN